MGRILDLSIRNEVSDPLFLAGVVVAKGVRVEPSPAELLEELDALVAQRKNLLEFPEPHKKDAIRSLLKRGGFKASGRNKPASEYLGQAAREDRFPRINNLVDINNLLSLETGLPISLLDLNEVIPELVLRYGREGEKYVFNSAGQEIELRGLIAMCGGADQVPVGNAVKDSMKGKLKEASSEVVGVVYASKDAIDPGGLKQAMDRFRALLLRFGGAKEAEVQVLGASVD